MPLPIFEKQAEIPKGFEEVYEEKDGKWHPKASDTEKLTATLDKVRQEKKAAEKAAKEADEARAELERKLTAASTGEEKDKVNKALAKFDSDLAAEKEKFQKQLDAANAELRTLKLDEKAKQAFLDAGGRPEKADAALKLKKERLDLADGRMVVKNDKGEVTTTTIGDFWGKEFKTEMPEFFTGTKASGGGAGGSTTAGGGSKFDDKMTAEQRLAAAHEAGLTE